MKILFKMFNDKTNEVIEKWYTDLDAADNLELLLNLLSVDFERWENGERVY